MVQWTGRLAYLELSGGGKGLYVRRKGPKEECRGMNGKEAQIAANNNESQAINGVTSCDL
ncbi:hypothetical protein BPAE_0096g00490 [Botrytis paeoniae]|uniref:Uncharacterized protein n=1 Tax=Botrytis paeoniae TaxID=278948 RepID=A0A4Z1FQH2_9HELO|nr:hypothetical protein BPAE_0096g00490 [Botrytis paeoniae]